MLLMNKDIPVLWFDYEEKIMTILNNDMLPLSLKDGLKNSDIIKTIPEGMKNFGKLEYFFASRVLSISRDNAKEIMQSIGNKQKLTQEESCLLSLKCRGVSISDNFWIKEDEECISFQDINIRNRSLSDITFQVSMKGTPISLQHDILALDISTNGMFRKTWRRINEELWLYKSDKTSDFINTKAEIDASDILEKAGIKHVKYEKEVINDILCCKCKCFTSDDTSFVDAEGVKEYCRNHNTTLLKFIKDNHFETDFANMTVMDYLIANPDEHINNWGFLVDANTNNVISMAPLFDNNQALIAIWANREKPIDDIIYDPTGLPMRESAIKWFEKTTINYAALPLYLQDRYKALVKEITRSSFKESIKPQINDSFSSVNSKDNISKTIIL